MIGKRIFSGHPNEEKVGYARAVVADGWVFVSGTTGFDAQTKQYPKDVEAQAENCFRNIERALKEAGASLADMVRVVVAEDVKPVGGEVGRESHIVRLGLAVAGRDDDERGAGLRF